MNLHQQLLHIRFENTKPTLRQYFPHDIPKCRSVLATLLYIARDEVRARYFDRLDGRGVFLVQKQPPFKVERKLDPNQHYPLPAEVDELRRLIDAYDPAIPGGISRPVEFRASLSCITRVHPPSAEDAARMKEFREGVDWGMFSPDLLLSWPTYRAALQKANAQALPKKP